jgi:hypothetical protein
MADTKGRRVVKTVSFMMSGMNVWGPERNCVQGNAGDERKRMRDRSSSYVPSSTVFHEKQKRAE